MASDAVTMSIQDVRLIGMGRSSRMLWIELVTIIHEIGHEGIIYFGTTVSGLRSLAHLMRTTESELAVNVAAFADRGLILWGERVSIGVPPEFWPPARTVAARINGRKGGRPRKVEVAPGASVGDANRVRLISVTNETA